MKRFFFGVLVLLALSYAACSPALFVPCENAEDCKGLLQCIEGQCRHRYEGFTPIVQKIYGTTDCLQGIPKGASGKQTLHLFPVVGDYNRQEALDLEYSAQSPLQLSTASFAIVSDESSPVQVFNYETGERVTQAQAVLTIDASEPIQIKPNPRNTALRKNPGQWVPQAFFLGIDMSDNALSQDNGALRTAAPGSLILDVLDAHLSGTPYSILSTILLRRGKLSPDDYLFRNWERKDDQLPAEQGGNDGFVVATRESVELFSERFISTGNPVSDGTAPLMEGIAKMVQSLRKHAVQDGEQRYNPNAIVLSLSRGSAADQESKYLEAKKAIQGSGNDFVPLQAIVWSKPRKSDVLNPPSTEQWNQHIERLCKLAHAGGTDESSFGHLFHIAPSVNRDRYKEQLRSHLGAAFYASKGYVAVRIQYKLSGVPSGGRYVIAFKVQGTWLGRTSESRDSPYIYMTVEP